MFCRLERVSAAIARGKRPVPFRTRKLSLSASMVLQGGPCGRVDRRRTSFKKSANVLIKFNAVALFFFGFFHTALLLHISLSSLTFRILLQLFFRQADESRRSILNKKEREILNSGPLRDPRNEVFLQGRVSGEPVEKELPSGDLVVEFRLVIDRAQSRSQKREVDTLDIAVWSARARKRALTLSVDDWVAIQGSIRRRFWRAPTGLASRWQVEASQLRRL